MNVRQTISWLSAGLLAATLMQPFLFAQTDNPPNPSAMEKPDDWPAVEFEDAADRAAAFRPNETFTFRVGWGIFQGAGEILMTTAEKKEAGHDVFVIRTVSTTRGIIRALYPVDTETKSTLDPQTWRTLSYAVKGQQGSEKSSSLLTVDYQKGVVNFVDNLEPKNNASLPLPYPITMDFVSALFQTRAWPMEIGKSYPLFVQGSGKAYLLSVEVLGRETIDTPLGSYQAFHLKPTMDYKPSGIFARGGGIDLWISDDPLRLPLRIDLQVAVGTARIYLDQYKSPSVDLKPVESHELTRPQPHR